MARLRLPDARGPLGEGYDDDAEAVVEAFVGQVAVRVEDRLRPRDKQLRSRPHELGTRRAELAPARAHQRDRLVLERPGGPRPRHPVDRLLEQARNDIG